MYRLRPTGTHVVSVCTNLACKLRGAEAVYEAAHEAPAMAHGAGGQRRRRCSRCTRRSASACATSRPAVQVDFANHDDGDARADARADRVAPRAATCPAPARGPGVRELPGAPSRALAGLGEVRVVTVRAEPRLTRHWDDPERGRHRRLRRGRRVRGAAAGARDGAGRHRRGRQGERAARSRRGRVPHRDEVGRSSPRDTGKPTYVVVNFDESEPGTCNNRELVERDPHRLLEGTAIAALAIGCRDRVHLHPRRVPVAVDRPGARDRARPTTAGTSGADVAGSGTTPRRGAAPRRRRLHLRRGDGAAELARGAPRAAAPAAAVPGGRGPLRVARR